MNTPTPRTDERKASFALDTIRQLETELTAVTEQLKETQEALAAEIKHHTDIRTAVGDPTAKLMQDELDNPNARAMTPATESDHGK
jgi:hypothetical protein